LKKFLYSLGVLICIGVLYSCEFFLGPTVPKGSISGNVIDAETFEMLEGVELRLSGVTHIDTEKTNEEGFFKFLEAPTSFSYSIQFELDGYFSTTWNNILVEEGKNTSLYDPVGLHDGLLLIPRYLQSLGDLSVSGKVFHGSSDTPVAGARLTLRPGIDTWSSDGSQYLETQSDLSGEYSFTIGITEYSDENGLPPGYYTLEVATDEYTLEHYVIYLFPGKEITKDASLKKIEESLL